MTDPHVAPPLTRRQAREIERRTGQRPVATATAPTTLLTASAATGTRLSAPQTAPAGSARVADQAALAADVRRRIEIASQAAQSQMRAAANARAMSVTEIAGDDVSSTAELAKGSLAAYSATFAGPETVRAASIKAAKPAALVRRDRRRRGAGITLAASAAAVATVAAVTPSLGLTPDVAQASLVSPDTATEETPDEQAATQAGTATAGQTDGATQTVPLVAAPEEAVDRGEYTVTTVSADGVAETAEPTPEPAPEPPVIAMEYMNPYPAGSMNEGYGTRGGSHNGIDMVGGGCGADLVAVAAGTVTFAGMQGGYGNHVELDLGDGTTVSYSHIQPGGIGVSVGQQVNAGDYIGAVGTTGNSTGCHLHFEVKQGGSFVNPVPWLTEHGIAV